MHATGIALVGFIAVTAVLLLLLAFLRVHLTLSGARAPNSFGPDGSDVSAYSARLCRAHANCYESFPILGGLLLLALATDMTSITDGLAYYVLGARILQVFVHVASTSNKAVQLRFALFLVQIVIAAWWMFAFLTL